MCEHDIFLAVLWIGIADPDPDHIFFADPDSGTYPKSYTYGTYWKIKIIFFLT
jgi:hypothetical protein